MNAEIVWTVKSVKAHSCFSSTVEIGQLQRSFPTVIAKKFAMAKTVMKKTVLWLHVLQKVGYIVTINAAALLLLYTQSKHLSCAKLTWYNIVVTLYVKHVSPMTICGEDSLVTLSMQGN